jgi:hypothetical protein
MPSINFQYVYPSWAEFDVARLQFIFPREYVERWTFTHILKRDLCPKWHLGGYMPSPTTYRYPRSVFDFHRFVCTASVEKDSANSDELRDRLPPWCVDGAMVFGFLLGWWGWHNLRNDRRLLWGTFAFISGMIVLVWAISVRGNH